MWKAYPSKINEESYKFSTGSNHVFLGRRFKQIFNYASPMDRFLIVMPKEGTMKRKKDVRRHALGANFAKAIAMK